MTTVNIKFNCLVRHMRLFLCILLYQYWATVSRIKSAKSIVMAELHQKQHAFCECSHTKYTASCHTQQFDIIPPLIGINTVTIPMEMSVFDVVLFGSFDLKTKLTFKDKSVSCMGYMQCTLPLLFLLFCIFNIFYAFHLIDSVNTCRLNWTVFIFYWVFFLRLLPLVICHDMLADAFHMRQLLLAVRF